VHHGCGAPAVRTFADPRCWYLPIRARIDGALVERVLTMIGPR